MINVDQLQNVIAKLPTIEDDPELFRPGHRRAFIGLDEHEMYFGIELDDEPCSASKINTYTFEVVRYGKGKDTKLAWVLVDWPSKHEKES